MRVILIGSDLVRARLRAQADGALVIAGEFPTAAAARAAAVDCDAWLVGADRDDADRHDDDDDDDERRLVEALTDRELDVLELVAEGLSNKAIAARLGISDQTVKFHVASMSGKLGAHNRTETVRRALRRGLIAI
ncbi:MAG: helix-turn-helix domain-containing protein [Vicinamibacterales bacterium]